MKTSPTIDDGDAYAFNIVPLADVQGAHIVELLSSNLSSVGATTKSVAFWRWKHAINPFGESLGCAALSKINGELVGIRPLMKWAFQSKEGNLIHALRPVDTVTHQNWQGKGLFKTLTIFCIIQLADDPTTLVFNTPNQNSLPGYEKMGWIRTAQLSIFVRVGNPAHFAVSGIHWLLSHIKPRGHGVAQELKELDQGLDDTAVEEIIGFCTAAESKRIPAGTRTVRSKEYLAWRYFQQPNIHYGFHISRNNLGCIESIVIYRMEYRGLAELLLIVDIFVKESDSNLVRAGIRSLIRGTKAHFYIAHAADATLELKAIKKEMFFKAKEKVLAARIVGRAPSKQQPNEELSQMSWDLTFSDIEIF